MWSIDTTRHYKIWFSTNRASFLPLENQLVFIQMREKNPAAKISFIYSSSSLDEQALSQLKAFCLKYKIEPLDFDQELPQLLEDQRDKEFYSFAQKELIHVAGTPMAASNYVRLMIPVIEKLGCYADFDVVIDFSASRSLPVKQPVIFPTEIMEDGAPYVNNYFIAVAEDKYEAGSLNPEAVAALRQLQEFLVKRHKGSLLEAFTTHAIPGLTGTNMMSNSTLFAVLVNYCQRFPKGDIFDFRELAFKQEKEFKGLAKVNNIFLEFEITKENLSWFKSEILRLSVLAYSGVDTYPQLLAKAFPEEGFSYCAVHKEFLPKANFSQFVRMINESGLVENDLLVQVKSKVSPKLQQLSLEQTAGVYRDASWTDVGSRKMAEREASLLKIGHSLLFNYRQKKNQSPEELLQKSTMLKAHQALLRDLRPKIATEPNYFKPLLSSILAKNYGQALRRVCNDKHKGASSLAAILLKFKDSLRLDLNEKDGAALQLAANNSAHPGIYDLLIEAGADERLAPRQSQGISLNR